MNHVSVASSNIETIGYDEDTRVLAVTMKDGGRAYHYQNVPPEAHSALMAAPSIGIHIHEHIKGKYDYMKQEKLS